MTNVTQCYHECPFFAVEDIARLMICKHPYWKNKAAYAGTIINHGNSKGRVPDKCPLRKSDYIETQHIHLVRS